MALRDTTKIKGAKDQKIPMPPEGSLWLAVLELAINDYITGTTTGRHTDEYRSAKEWIFGESQSAINSFDSICLLFNMSPDLTRKALHDDPFNIKLRLAGKKVEPKENV